MILFRRSINLKLLLLVILVVTSICYNVIGQDTFESGIGPWHISSNSPGNGYTVGTSAGNGYTIPGCKSLYVSWNNSSYGAINSPGTCLAYRKYENLCNQSTLHFDYRINGFHSNQITDEYYGVVVYSYDSTTWIYGDTLRNLSCYMWANKSESFVFTSPTVYVGFLYVNDVDSFSVCSPLAVDNVLMTCDTPLPIQLTGFELKYYDCFIDVKFTTESEMNSKVFIIQYSTNATVWSDICKFKAAGQSVNTITYQKSKVPFFPLESENSYFRIVEVDVFGYMYYYDVTAYSLINDCEDNMQYYDILGKYYDGGLIKLSKGSKKYNYEVY